MGMQGKQAALWILMLVFAVIAAANAGWLWKAPHLVESTRLVMDTSITVKLYADSRDEGGKLIDRAFAEADRIETIMEPLKNNGELQRLNAEHAIGWYEISPELRTVLERCAYFYRITDGAFDPTIAAVKWLWDFENGGVLPDSSAIATAMRTVGFDRFIELRGDSLRIGNPGTKLDLGGVAKGYAVERMMDILRSGEVTGALVNAGGDIMTWGTKPGGEEWLIGLRHPRITRTLVLDPVDYPSVATSGDYERFFLREGVRYHHILDPRDGYPARASISVTTWTESPMDADILSTALFVLGPGKGRALAERLPGVDALIFYEENGTVRHVATGDIGDRIPL